MWSGNVAGIVGMFAAESAVSFAAPGRVNLIGEHTDYTGGLVLPMAIPFTTVATIAAATDGRYHFSSEEFAETVDLDRDHRSAPRGHWSDYVVGVLHELQELKIEVPAFQLRLHGDVPAGAGLSSSASVEVATAMALLHHARSEMRGAEIALLCQRAENRYVGSPCGIMDQFASANAVAGHAVLLHTRDLSYELLPLNSGALSGCVIVVANSGVKHSIAGGNYGLRRREVEAGQSVLQARSGVRDLGEATLEQLAACEDGMSPESFRRCRHIITENARTLEARDAMLAGDAVRLGAVMLRAHASERDDFECSVAEIDFLVETASGLPGCFGARLTGGGFGGCTVNLVAADAAEDFSRELRKAYAEQWNLPAATYTCAAVDGAVARAAAMKARER